MRMPKEAYHPNAYLSSIKNIKLGLRARTRVLNVLERVSVDAKTIAKEAEMHYGVVMHHLRLLEREGRVERKHSKPHIWVLTGLGQKRLVNLG
jgi:predicted ArsR family transcriptional regulator